MTAKIIIDVDNRRVEDVEVPLILRMMTAKIIIDVDNRRVEDVEVPLILRGPFMMTDKINVDNGKLKVCDHY